MDNQMLMLSIGLLGLIGINIILGSINSIFDNKFNRVKLTQGIVRGIIVTGCFVATYYIGKINPNVIVVKINEVDVNLLTGVYITTLTAFVAYGEQVLKKLAGFVVVKK